MKKILLFLTLLFFIFVNITFSKPSITLKKKVKNMWGSFDITIVMHDFDNNGNFDHADIWVDGEKQGRIGPFLIADKPNNTTSNNDNAFISSNYLTMDTLICSLDTLQRIDIDFYNSDSLKFAEYKSECNTDSGMLYNLNTTMFKSSIENEDIENTNIDIYPNPSSDILKLNLKNENIKSINIYNSNMNEIKSYTYNEISKSNLEISILDLTNGAYFIIIRTENNTFKSQFIKE